MRKTGAILLFLLPMLMWAASAADVTGERQRKADYYLTGALVREASEERDASFLMLRRAWELDSLGSVETGGLYGARLMTLSRGDSAMFHTGLRLLGLQFASDPSDLYAGYNLALNYERIGRNDDALRVWARLDSLNPENAGVLWKRATAEVLYGSKADALGLLDRVERLEGINPDIAVRKVGLLLQEGDTVAALTTVSRLLEAMPADAEARVYAAALYDQVGDTALASQNIARALEIDPTCGLAYYQQATRYKDQGRTEEYAAEIRRAIVLDDLDLENKMGLLADYLSEYADSEEHQPEIEQMFSAVLSQYPHDETLRRYVGGYYVGTGQPAKAAEQLGYVADMNREDPAVWEMLVRLYATADSLDRSVVAAREAVAAMPAEGGLRRLLGMVLSQSGRYGEAVATFREALELTDSADVEELSDIYTSMGDVWQQAGMPDSVAAAYETALKLNPDNDLALNNYAYYLAEMNHELARAEQMSSRSMFLRPGLATYLDTYAWILYRLGDYQQAKQYIDTAMLRSGDDLSSDLLEHAGDINYKIDRPEAALDYWRQALELDPDNGRLQNKVKTGKL